MPNQPRWPTDEEIAAAEGGHEAARQLASQLLARILPQFGRIKKPPRGVTRVTAHDKDGRILTTEKTWLPAYDGSRNLDKIAHNLWTGLSASAFQGHDALTGSDIAPYVTQVGLALGSRRGFVSRLKSLSQIESAVRFWQKADYWHGSHHTKARARASISRSHAHMRMMAEVARGSNDHSSG